MARKRTVKAKKPKVKVVHGRGRGAKVSDSLNGLTMADSWKHKAQARGQTGGHSKRIGKI